MAPPPPPPPDRYGARSMFVHLSAKEFDYFRLFIVATGCPSEWRPQKTVSCLGDSARIQDETTESSAWFFNVLGV